MGRLRRCQSCAEEAADFFDRFDPSPPKPGLFDDLIPKPYYHADYTGALSALALSFILYAAARAIGWVLDGFL